MEHTDISELPILSILKNTNNIMYSQGLDNCFVGERTTDTSMMSTMNSNSNEQSESIPITGDPNLGMESISTALSHCTRLCFGMVGKKA